MPSHRVERVAEAIREVVSSAVLFELSDPRIKGVTVLRAEVSGDLRNAAVLVTIMGTPSEQKKALAALRHAKGFLQSKVAARLQMRHTPAITIKLDEGVKKSVEISRLIDEALESDRKGRPPASVPEEAEEPDDDFDEDDD
jgi:ribosome-binding factor A